MFDKKDYTAMTLEELLAEEKKVKSNETLSMVFVGVLIGVLLYALVKNGFGIVSMGIPLFLIYVIHKNSQTQKHNLQLIQTEIASKNSK